MLDIGVSKLRIRAVNILCFRSVSLMFFEVSYILNEDLILHLKWLTICTQLLNVAEWYGLSGLKQLSTLLFKLHFHIIILMFYPRNKVITTFFIRPIQLLLELLIQPFRIYIVALLFLWLFFWAGGVKFAVQIIQLHFQMQVFLY